MGVDRVLAFFEGIEKLKEKYKEIISFAEVQERKSDIWYVMFHIEYMDAKIGGLYSRDHIAQLGYGLLEGFEMALKQTRYRLRRKFAKSRKLLKQLGITKESIRAKDDSYLIQLPKTTRIQGKKFEIKVEDGQLVWEVWE